MRYKLLAVLLPCALALSACTTVTPAYKDNGTRSGPCVEGGPDDVAQKFYDTQIQNRTQDPAALRPYLSDGLAQLLNDARQDQDAGFTSSDNMHIIELPHVEEVIAPIFYTVPLQLLAYHVALIKGTDVDQPRNLAKSVTVE